MTTYAAKAHDAIERAQRIRDQLARREETVETLKEQLAAVEKEVDHQLLLADLASHLREVSTKNMSEGQRIRHSALRKRLSEARSA